MPAGSVRSRRLVRAQRRGVAVAIAVVAALAAGTVAAAPSQAAPARPAPRTTKAEAGPHPDALTILPTNSTYARQILLALHPEAGEPTTASVRHLGGLLEDAPSPRFAIQVELLGPWLTDRITDDYQQFLDRAPDPGGLAHWRSVVGHAVGTSGSDIEQATVNIASSAESWRRAGSSVGGYVDRTYAKVLGRAADAGGRAYWIAKLDGGTSRQALVRTLLRSNERATRLVGAAYIQYLGRAADPGGRATWVGRYRSAKVGELGLITELLGSSEAKGSGCDPLDPRMCMLPFPSDRFTVPDATSATGRRIGFKREWLPKNAQGVAPNPQELNRNDGFSVGQAALLKVPGIDLAETGAAPINDIGASLDADAPIVVIDADTGERHPIFAELDANIPAAQQASDQLLYIRPAVDYTAGHRYIVALRNLKDADGNVIPARSSFTFYRDGDSGQGVGDAEARRPHMDQIFSELGAAGIAKDDLYLAWDFTVASTENTTGRLLHIRDDALAALGGHAPAYAITKVTPNPATDVAKRVEGTFDVPLYLKGDGSPGNAFDNGADGLPRRHGTYKARFDCEVPTLDPGHTARPVIYGHGLFGDLSEVRSGPQRSMVGDHDMLYCATDWIGMADQDLGNAATILKDVTTFPTLADRSQQGILNTIVLGRLLVAPDGLTANANFVHSGGPVIDTSDLFYDGNSQGGVIGGAFVAASPDVSAGVLGVAGMNYSNLLERSVDFDPFFSIMKTSYPQATDRVLGLQIIQMLWDRAETNGYAAHLTDDPLPGTPPHRVLIHTALGDHQVAPWTAEIEARTAGMAVHRPMYGPGRTLDVDPGWNLPSLDYPSTGSGLVIWDSGAVVAPLANVPNRAGADPHEDPRRSPLAQAQKDAFLRTDGTITDVCGSDPCTAPAT